MKYINKSRNMTGVQIAIAHNNMKIHNNRESFIGHIRV